MLDFSNVICFIAFATSESQILAQKKVNFVGS